MGTVYDPFSVVGVAASVLALNNAPPSSIARWQTQRLDQLLAHARETSAFYRERMRHVRKDEVALQAIEPVCRSELMERFDDWVTDPRLDLPSLRDFMADPVHVAQAYLGQYLLWESSGTSGQPGIFVQDAQALAVYDALESLRRCQPAVGRRWLDPFYLTERMAFVGATQGHFASFVGVERLRQLQPWLGPVMSSFSILDPVEALVEQLNDFSPTVLATYPTAAVMLAEEAERGHLHVHLHEIWTGGETLSPAMRLRIERAFQCRVRNSYGTSEFIAMGSECAHGGLHLNTDWLVLEPVDEHQRPVPPGQPSCGVLLTNLANRVQPLIRYQLGDHVCLHEEPCPCGSPFPVIEVAGRQDDILHMQGLGRTVPLLPLALSTVMEEQAGVFDFQIRQRNEHTLVLRLPQAGEAGRQMLARCRTVLQDFAASQGTTPIRVLGELGQVVPRGRSGKLCRIQASRP
ncbi:MAG: phenylacetate--CoA ligase family protein [Hydrogenophaga sp.]|jgi:phenylacetate-coenzyme A ligase PaaK-like adenylate-forming protein|nr:phenylacetate--CoA ligase family protein [Hydrogenophaga sp.]